MLKIGWGQQQKISTGSLVANEIKQYTSTSRILVNIWNPRENSVSRMSLTEGCNTKYSSRQIGHGFPVDITPALCRKIQTCQHFIDILTETMIFI